MRESIVADGGGILGGDHPSWHASGTKAEKKKGTKQSYAMQEALKTLERDAVLG